MQNVLFERRTFKYADGPQKVVAWEPDIVDSGSETAFPFYNEPGVVSRGGKEERIVPYLQLSYNQTGFQSGAGGSNGKQMNETSGEVSLIDQPWFRLRLRNKNAALLTEATQILTFGIWLVVLSEDRKPQVLAHTEPFSLMFTCKLTPVGTASTISVPSTSFQVKASKGTAKTTSTFPKAGGVRCITGPSKSGPVLAKKPDDKRDDAWSKLYQAL